MAPYRTVVVATPILVLPVTGATSLVLPLARALMLWLHGHLAEIRLSNVDSRSLSLCTDTELHAGELLQV